MSSDGSDGPELPPPPPAVIELRALEDRYGEMVDWVLQATSDAYRERSRAFFKAQSIENLNLRSKEHVAICERLAARCAEIDRTEEEFKKAYEETKKSLDGEAILTYACLIRPMLDAEEKKLSKLRSEQRLEEARKKSQLLQEREERRRQRLKKKAAGRTSGEEHPGDRDLSQADRTSKAPDERAGGGALADDRGVHGDPGRVEGPSRQADAVESPGQDDRVQPQVGGVDRKGPAEQGL